MRAVLIGTILGTIGALAGCGDSRPASPATTNAAPVATPATAPMAAPALVAETTLLITGPIIVEHQIELTAQRDGVLEKLFFDAPARVKQGTLLAKLDTRQLEANLSAARAKTRGIEADLKNWESEGVVLKADYDRAKRMYDLGLSSQEQLEHAKYKAESDQYDIQRVKESLNTAKEEERALELEVEKAKVTAPFSGLIARRYVHEGQNVAKGERLFWLTAEAPLLMRFTVPERLFGKVRNGQEFDVTSPDLPGELHRARVKQISPVVDPSSGTFEVLVELIGNTGNFRPGMTAGVRLDAAR